MQRKRNRGGVKKEEFIEQYQDMARRLAWSFHRTTGVELEELLGEAFLALVRTPEKYNPRKRRGKARVQGGGLSTFTFRRITNRLTTVTNKELKRRGREFNIEVQEREYVISPERVAEFRELIRKSSPDCQEVCKLVLTAPHEFISIVRRGASRKVKGLLWDEGWTVKDIWAALHEIKALLKEEL